LGFAPHLLDKLAAPEHPRIPGHGVPLPPLRNQLTPATRTPDEAPTLEIWAAALGNPGCHKLPVACPRTLPGCTEMGEDRLGVLPRSWDRS
jgi:hypothetical protein